MTKYDLAIQIAKTFDLPLDLIREKNVSRPAKRPLDARLNIKKLLKTIKVKIHSIDEGLKVVKTQMNL